ncbi:vomeronasal type-2 receptor 116-like, partial [Mus pahari]|uniref:vomeronasal type-2 receptor 116-like n=1 Tax=Mus pahari TaxID=10093 RepID=UPI000A30A8D7
MFTLMLLFFLLNILLLMSSLIHPKCFWKIKLGEDKDGDLETNCVFSLEAVRPPVEKEYFNQQILNVLTSSKNHQFALALAFSMDEVNRNSDLLPNMSLVLKYPMGGCKEMSQLYNIFELYVQNNNSLPNYVCNEETTCAVLITGPQWQTSVNLLAYLGIYLCPKVLQIAYGNFHPILNDHEQFPYLYQMAPKDTSLALAMVAFMCHFSWNWVGLVISDNDKGTSFLSYLRRQMEKNKVCFAFVYMIPEYDHLYESRAEVYYNQIMASSTSVVIIYGDSNNVLALSFKIWKSLGIQKLWVTTSEWDVTTSKTLLHDSLHGTLAFVHHHGDISGFKNFVQTLNPLKNSSDYLLRLGWMDFNCEASASYCKTLENCSSNASLEWLREQNFDVAFSDGSYDIYNAVYAMAHALHEMILQQVDNQAMDNGKGPNFDCLKLNSFLRRIHFTNPIGDTVNMNLREKLQRDYDIFQIRNFSHGLEFKVKIAKFSSYFPHGQQLHLHVDMIEWATGKRK